jgi:signal peptidase I
MIFTAYNTCNFSAMSFFSHKKPEFEAVDETLTEHTEHPLAEIVRFAIIAILIVVPIRMFVAQPFIVSGASMETTFHSGEYLIVDQLSYHFHQPHRGEVIVFRYPRDPSKFFIKRIVGEPGDTVTIENGTVYIANETDPDGFALTEAYAEKMPPAPKLTETLGDREYFVMGDNRDESSDSRTWGVLQQERIVGRAWVRLFPPSVLDYLPGVADPAVISES